MIPARRFVASALVALVGRPLAWLAGLLGVSTLPFGLVRSRRTVIRDGWILGDRDR